MFVRFCYFGGDIMVGKTGYDKKAPGAGKRIIYFLSARRFANFHSCDLAAL
jgi:hypothetical protein